VSERSAADEVPDHLKDSSRDAAGLGHGRGYRYPHDFEGHWTPQQYLPTHLLGETFYTPSNEGYEREIAARLARWRAAQERAREAETKPTSARG